MQKQTVLNGEKILQIRKITIKEIKLEMKLFLF